MTAHSILFLGRGGFVNDYLHELETLSCCSMLSRNADFELPVDAAYSVDLILLEVGPSIVEVGKSIGPLLQSLRPYPVVALTEKAHENRGIAAVNAGAAAYICVDDITVDRQELLFDHAVQRSQLQRRLSASGLHCTYGLGRKSLGCHWFRWSRRAHWVLSCG